MGRGGDFVDFTKKCCEFLQIPFYVDKDKKPEFKLLLPETRHRFGDFCRKIETVLVRFNGEGRQPKIADLRAIYHVFQMSAQGGMDSLKNAFSQSIDLKHLAWALNFTDKGKLPPIMDGPHFSLALELFEEDGSIRIFRSLFFLLVREWGSMKPGPRALLQKSLDRQLDNLSARIAIVRDVSRFRKLFFAGDGTMEMGRRLMDSPPESLQEYLSPDREPSSTSSGELPLFLTVKNAPAFILDGVYCLVDMAMRLKRLPDFLPLVLPLMEKAGRGPALTRLLTTFILWAHANPGVASIWKEDLKRLAISKVGDPQDSGTWSEWPGISVQGKKELAKAKEILNLWISEQLIGIFFEKLIHNKERKDFWLPYAKKVSVRIFCNDVDKRTVLRDDRVERKSALNRMGGLKGQGAALVMEYGEYLLVEFSEHGNAFYAYLKKNLQYHGLSKFLQVLDGESKEPLKIAEMKKTKYQTMSKNEMALYQEGRYHHRPENEWQDKLQEWLSKRVKLRL